MNIEEYEGSSFNDRITGTSQNEIFRDMAGNDFIVGGGGNDIYHAGSGNDIYTEGGAGDQFFVAGAFGIDAILDAKPGVAVVVNGIDLATTQWRGFSFFGQGFFKDATNTLTLVSNGVDALIKDPFGNELFLGKAISNRLFTFV